MHGLVCAVLAGWAGGITAADKDVPVKTIDCSDLKLERVDGRITDPKIITSEEELAKAVADKESREKIAKQVDFKTQKLIYFAWSGSGGDRLSCKPSGEKEVVFQFTPGVTFDLRAHFHLFVVPKDAAWKLKGT